MSTYTTTGELPATLDFGFQQSAVGYAQGKPTTKLRDLFAGDDYYTDTDSNAYELPTFLGNHDMGRIGMFLERRRVRPGTAGAGRAGALADVPDPRPAGRLLRRRAGLHRQRRRQGRPPGHVRHPDRATTPTRRRRRTGTTRSAARTATTPRAAVPAHRALGAAAGRQPGAGRRRADPPLRRPTAPASSRSAGSTRGQGRVPRRREQRDDRQDRDVRHVQPERRASAPVYGGGTTRSRPDRRGRRVTVGAAVGAGLQGANSPRWRSSKARRRST